MLLGFFADGTLLYCSQQNCIGRIEYNIMAFRQNFSTNSYFMTCFFFHSKDIILMGYITGKSLYPN